MKNSKLSLGAPVKRSNGNPSCTCDICLCENCTCGTVKKGESCNCGIICSCDGLCLC